MEHMGWAVGGGDTDEMSLLQADLEAEEVSLNTKADGSLSVFFFIVVSFFPSVIFLQKATKVFTGFYRRHRLDFCGSFHVSIDSFLCTV